MKRIALILAFACALLMLAACNDTPKEPNTPGESTNESQGESDTNESKKGNIVYFEKTNLELEKDPVYENGKLILYFTDHSIQYSADSQCIVGFISYGAADSYKATPDMETYPDMKTDSGYCGVALIPEDVIPAGNYTFNISLDSYVITFDMTIEK